MPDFNNKEVWAHLYENIILLETEDIETFKKVGGIIHYGNLVKTGFLEIKNSVRRAQLR